jgi:hypothetical protein
MITMYVTFVHLVNRPTSMPELRKTRAVPRVAMILKSTSTRSAAIKMVHVLIDADEGAGLR